MSITSATSVGMEQFKNLLTMLSPEVSIAVRGRHAIGKSEGVYQAAANIKNDFYKDPDNCQRVVAAFGGTIKTPDGKVDHWKYEYGTPVMERRLSQMTEGDIIGLPFNQGEDKFDYKTGARISFSSTQFKPCDWLITAAHFPTVLFLDERNRALPGVKQAVFQLTDSKAFYGTHLHEDTRIVIAENIGDEYQVEACDPAETSRCATVDLHPSVEDFIGYITERCNPILVSYLRQNNSLIEHKGAYEPNKKYPDRRSWFKLDKELERLGLYEDPTSPMLHIIIGSFVGTEIQSSFADFIRENQRHVSAEEIIKDWKSAKKRLSTGGPISNEAFMECSNKLKEWLTDNLMDDDQIYELARFMFDAPAEIRMNVFAAVQNKMENMTGIHKYIKDLIVYTTGHGDEENPPKLPQKVVSNKKTASKTSKRGGKKQ